MSYWEVPPIYSGETVFILGCGPSLEGFNFDLLRGKPVIAINDNYKTCPWAPILYFCDEQRWWFPNSPFINRAMHEFIVTLENDISGVKRLRNSGEYGLELNPMAIRHGHNSGYQAMNLAYHLGARRIVLLGYDMKIDGQKVHHTRRRDDVDPPPVFFQTLTLQIKPAFEHIKEPLALAGVEVINCTPGSALLTWPQKPLNEVLF